LGNASAIGTKVRPPCSSAMTIASAPSDLPDLMASDHSSLADFHACERASSMVASSEPSRSSFRAILDVEIVAGHGESSASPPRGDAPGDDPRSGWPQLLRGPLFGSHASSSQVARIPERQSCQVNIAHPEVGRAGGEIKCPRSIATEGGGKGGLAR